MTPDIALHVQGLGKRYRIGEMERYLALRDVLTRAMNAPMRRLRGETRPADAREVWALKDVSFDIDHGEMVGVIGKNGAGKSTLLKLLSRVTHPTTGRALVHGRLGSLLEVGTGFHPELTGRENVRLSAAILGMTRAELDRKFDDIVEFSEIGRYLDTPVKRYSSGMYTRLAFSVAAHLDPDILLIDEVLAVGDADFQRKCIGRMDELSSAGRTILVVSHNMAVVKAATARAIWLERGTLRGDGPSKAIVDEYLLGEAANVGRAGTFDETHLAATRVKGWALGQLELRRVRLYDETGLCTARFMEGSSVDVALDLVCHEAVNGLRLTVPVSTLEGQVVFRLDPGFRPIAFTPGAHEARLRFETSALMPGIYRAEIIVESKMPQDRVLSAFEFEIITDPKAVEDPYTLLYDSTSDPASRRSDRALVRVPHRWVALPSPRS